jgi:hypothetical protein
MFIVVGGGAIPDILVSVTMKMGTPVEPLGIAASRV